MARTAKNFFSEKDKEAIITAIKSAELDTSGEIRVHIEDVCSGDVLERAKKIFFQLGINKTEQKNGVLFYLAIKSRKFAIIGDEGINAVVPDNFWDNIKQKMLNKFREDKFVEGLTEGIIMAGQQLKALFPYKRNDVNELPDEISFA